MKLANELLKVLKEQDGEEVVPADGSGEVEGTPPVNVASVIADKLIDLGLDGVAVAVDIVDTDAKINITSGDVQGIVSFGFEDKKPFVNVERIGVEGGVKIDLSGIEGIPQNDKGGVDLSDVSWISDSIWQSIMAALGLTKVEAPEEKPEEPTTAEEPAADGIPATVEEPAVTDVAPAVSAEAVTKRFEAFKKRKRTA